MLVIYPHGSRETEHGSTSQCWPEKEQQKDCEWVQSAQKIKFKCRITHSTTQYHLVNVYCQKTPTWDQYFTLDRWITTYYIS